MNQKILFLPIYLFLNIALFINYATANPWEIDFTNQIGTTITVKVYPVSMVFNADWYPTESDPIRGYNLYMVQTHQGGQNKIDFINGRNSSQDYFHVASGLSNHIVMDFDRAGGLTNPGNSAVLGFGRYRFDIWYSDINPDPDPINYPPDDYFTIEYDDDYGKYSFASDIVIQLVWVGSPQLQYMWGNMSGLVPIPSNRKIESWHQVYPNFWRNKAYGDFRYNSGQQINNPYTVIPQDPRKDCNPGGGILNQNHIFQREEFGVLSLNLTIEKNISTPTSAPYIENSPPSIIIEGDPSTQTGASLNIGSYPNWHTLTFNPYDLPNSGLGTFLLIEPYANLNVKGSMNPASGSSVVFQNNCHSEVSTNGVINLWPHATISLYGNSHMLWDYHSEILCSQYSEIYIHDNAVVNNCNAITRGLQYTLSENGKYNIGINCPYSDNYSNNIGCPDSGGHIILNDQAQVNLGQNCKIVFDGPDSYLEANPGTTISFDQNSGIEFTNGAYLSANGCTFTGTSWNGLKFTNGGACSISNCTFTGAATCVDISNDKYHDTSQINISGNTFNDGKVTIDNGTNLYVLSNIFNCYNLTGDLLEVTNDLGELPENYHLDINYNTFEGGTGAQIRLDCYAGIITPFYITYNNFYGPNSGGITGLLAYNIAGDFKNNNFQNDNYSLAAELISCNLNFYNNSLKSLTGNTLTMVENSTARLAPVLNGDGTFTWYGGYNKIYLDYKDAQKSYTCAYFESGSNLYTDQGKNCFYIYDIPTNSHISGDLPNLCSMNPYYAAANNYWNTTPPQFQIYCGGNLAGVNYTPTSETCPSTGDNTPISYAVTNMGGGIYDSISVTPGPGNGGLGGGESSVTKAPPVNNDRTLYALILHQKMQKDYSEAISNSVQLINTYDTSKYLASALDELYLCYQASDTSNNQNTTTVLFGQLKTYLVQKISDYQDLTNFVEKAYNYYLMCLVKQRAFTEAIAGYENIMNYNPDPLRRLTASWDRAAVVLLMNSGGGAPNIVSKLEYPEAKFQNKDPHKLVKDVFLKKQKEESDNEGKARKNEKYTKDDKAELQSRTVKFNPSTKKEFKEKIASDMMMVLGIQSKASIKTGQNNISIPKVFKLYQNYPNPFNPETMIKYDLPKDGLVSIKVYDLLGKVVFSKTEYKLAGTYDFSFNGSSYASGLYFYRIEAGTFVDSKKMVLIK